MKYNLFIPILFFVMLISCKKEQDKQDDTVIPPPAAQPPVSSNAFYPLVIGHQWSYMTTVDLYLPNPYVHFTDYSTYTLTSDTAFGTYDSLLVQVAKDSTDDGGLYQYRNYYMMNDSGLFNCGYLMGSNPRVFLRNKNEGTFEIGGMKFNSRQELSAFFSTGNSVMADSLIIESPACPTLKKPLVLNEVWAYRDYSNPFYIGKKYTGNENVVTNFGSFSCKKIQFIYDLNTDSIPDPDINITQYISPTKGLLKETKYYYNVTFTDSTGTYTGNWEELSIATAINF
jgi:hypothetical protein